ncbi:DMT family transporter [Clostridium sp. LBM24168]
MKSNKYNSIFFAVSSSLLYAISIPVSKVLLKEITPTMMSTLLYFGAGSGMFFINLIIQKKGKSKNEEKLTKNELPFIIGMIVSDIAAPIFLMMGLTLTTSSNASLLSNFEIAATSIIAFIIFNEPVNKRLWTAIILITISCIILSIHNTGSFSFSIGSLFIVSCCIFWGFENNCTRMLSTKDPMEIVIIKGLGSSAGSFLIALFLNQWSTNILFIISAIIIGFFSYGLSIFFYVYAQRYLGAAKTSAYYALTPFISAGLSFIILKETPNTYFFLALIIMIAGTYLVSTDSS